MCSEVQLNQIFVTVFTSSFMTVTVICKLGKNPAGLALQMGAMWGRCHQLDAHWGRRDVNDSEVK